MINNLSIKNNNKKEKIFKTISISSIFILLFLSIIISSQIYIKREFPTIFLILMIFFFIILLFSTLEWFLTKNQNKKFYEQKIGEKILDTIQNSTCEINNFIDTKDLYNIGILPFYDLSYGNYLIKFSKDNKKYAFCNINLQLSIDSNEVEIYNKEIFKGQVYIFDCKKNINDFIRIISCYRSGPFMNKNINNIKSKEKSEISIKTESEEFNENFEIYSPNEHSAFYLLDSNVMEKLIKLRKKYNLFNIYISTNKVVLIINTDRMFFDNTYITNEKILEETINKDINELLQTINDFEKILSK